MALDGRQRFARIFAQILVLAALPPALDTARRERSWPAIISAVHLASKSAMAVPEGGAEDACGAGTGQPLVSAIFESFAFAPLWSVTSISAMRFNSGFFN